MGLKNHEGVDQAGDSGMTTKLKSGDVEEEGLLVHRAEEQDTETTPKSSKEEDAPLAGMERIRKNK